MIRLTHKLAKDFTVPEHVKEIAEWSDERMKKINEIEFYQPGGTGTHWVGLVAGWHCFLDALEGHLREEPYGQGHTLQCLMYYSFIKEYFEQEETVEPN